MAAYVMVILTALACTLSAVVSDASAAELREFHSRDLGIRFEYPVEWGNPVITYLKDSPRPCATGRYGRADWSLGFDEKTDLQRNEYSFTLIVYDDIVERPIRCYAYEEEEIEYNLTEVAADAVLNANTRVGTLPAKFEDRRFEPAQTAHRAYVWGTGSRLYCLDVYTFLRAGEGGTYAGTIQRRSSEAETRDFVAAIDSLLASIVVTE
jgi:hypothetical protein